MSRIVQLVFVATMILPGISLASEVATVIKPPPFTIHVSSDDNYSCPDNTTGLSNCIAAAQKLNVEHVRISANTKASNSATKAAISNVRDAGLKILSVEIVDGDI